MKNWPFLLLLWTCLYACSNPTNNYNGFPKADHINAHVEGFEVQKISGGEGEFLSINIDPQGRLLVSPRRGKLLRFAVNDAQQPALQIDTLDVGVTDCQGLLYAYGHLYMMGSGPDDKRGIYRLADTDGKGNSGAPRPKRQGDRPRVEFVWDGHKAQSGK